ncbi:hypothetical protein [Streptomyces lutosisoli]|uniref:Uncharacterized protein n=1 Tax=Streptomyces lutosisoli TaxID=2665721 RepID=A0ABW2VPN3_9ACTN
MPPGPTDLPYTPVESDSSTTSAPPQPRLDRVYGYLELGRARTTRAAQHLR